MGTKSSPDSPRTRLTSCGFAFTTSVEAIGGGSFVFDAGRAHPTIIATKKHKATLLIVLFVPLCGLKILFFIFAVVVAVGFFDAELLQAVLKGSKCETE